MGRQNYNDWKMREDVKAFAAQQAAAPAREAARLFAARIVSLWQAREARGAAPLFVPTIGAAITAGRPCLAFHCPACSVTGRVDLRTLDRHPDMPVTGLIPSLSCKRCAPNSPFAKLDGLHPMKE